MTEPVTLAADEVVVPAADRIELATDTGMITVNENVATVLWGEPLPKLATQGAVSTLPLRVYAPATGTGVLTLTVTGPGDDPTTQPVSRPPRQVTS